MKKFTKRAIFALMTTVALSASAFEIDEINGLYIVGNASLSGYDRGLAPELVQGVDEDGLPNGVYTWEGLLQAGDFKFVIDRDSWDSVNANSEDAPVMLGTPMRINFGGDDNKWVVEKAGLYNITVDVNNRNIEVNYGQELYLVGGALSSGYNRGDAPAAKVDANGRYVFSGLMQKGEFKFLISRYSWDSVTAAEADAPISLNTPSALQLSGDDNKWIVTEAGLYTVTVDLAEATVTATQAEAVYLVGGAVATGWDRGAAPAVTLNADGCYAWSGYLSAGDFKFVVSRDSWDSLNASAENLPLVVGEPMTVNVGGLDYKWMVTESGNYNMVLDFVGRTLTVTRDESAFVPTSFAISGSALNAVPTHMFGDIYKYIGAIGAGTYQISASNGVTTMWVKATESGFKYVSKAAATTFEVAEAMDRATLVINAVAGTVDVEEYVAWTDAWTIGSFGWGFSDDYKFTQTDADTFVWEGYLSTEQGAEIKFTCADNYDSENSIHPYQGNQSLTDATVWYKGGSDLKWLIPESNWYRITLNTYLQTIEVEIIDAPQAEPVQGDVNGDGEVTVADVTELINALLGEGDNPAADVNNDGYITVSDVTELINIMLN